MPDNPIDSLESLQETLSSQTACLLYFSSPSCSVCQVLRPKIMQAVNDKFPQMQALHVDLSITPEIGSEYNVLAAPTVIVFLEGKEFIRKYRNMSVEGLMQEIQRPYSLLMES